jgi:hypothetical protein
MVFRGSTAPKFNTNLTVQAVCGLNRCHKSRVLLDFVTNDLLTVDFIIVYIYFSFVIKKPPDFDKQDIYVDAAHLN